MLRHSSAASAGEWMRHRCRVAFAMGVAVHSKRRGARSTMSPRDPPVIIVGAGPVGLNLALFLDKLGVESVVLEAQRVARWHPRGSTHNSRTMEHYRWLGIADNIRAVGLPEEHSADIAYFTSRLFWELARFRLPSRRQN